MNTNINTNMTMSVAQLLVDTQKQINEFLEKKNTELRQCIPDLDITFIALTKSKNIGLKDFHIIKMMIEKVLNIDDLTTKTREDEYVMAREFIVRIFRDNFPDVSLKKIGNQYLRNNNTNTIFDHSTIINCIKNFEKHIHTEQSYYEKWQSVHDLLNEEGIFIINKYKILKNKNQK